MRCTLGVELFDVRGVPSQNAGFAPGGLVLAAN